MKVKEAVSPAFKAVLSEAIKMVGARVSNVIVNCVAGELLLPAVSVKAPVAISKVAVVVLFAVGVKVVRKWCNWYQRNRYFRWN